MDSRAKCKILLIFSFVIIIYITNGIQLKYAKSLFQKSKSIHQLPNKRVLYLSIHTGTIDEIEFVLTNRQINYTVSSLDIHKNNGYRITEEMANKIINSGLVKRTCDEYDVIIIGDTIPLGRPFYQASPDLCKSKILLQITNRFDWAIEDRKSYILLMHKLAQNPNIYWVPNNDFELYYVALHEIYPKQEKTFVIKPFGVSREKKKEVKLSKTIIYTHSMVDLIRNLFKSMNISCSKYEIYTGPKYGGPLTLKENKLFVYIPYQFSTMKVFQNANYRIFTAIPSPHFYREIILSNRANVMPLIIELLESNAEWTQYFDVYNEKYIDMYLKFDSWSELADIVNGGMDLNAARAQTYNRMKRIMAEHWIENENKWNELFKTLF